MKRARCLAAAAAAVVPSLLVAALGSAATAAPLPDPKPPVPHCVTPSDGDLNELFDVKDRIIGPAPCRETYAKAKWVRIAPGWGTAPSAAEAVYPAGYTPERPDPIDDFDSKFVSATYIHDLGTPQEQRFTYKKSRVLRTGLFGPDGRPYSIAISPPFKALDLGTHTTIVLFTLKAQHCDGLGTVEEENCLPAGTFEYTGNAPFEVVPKPTG
ncbi:hypothetical protein ACFYM0_32155 [Streptomyces sp. NPDC006487]|uniref:hypothetical protein n=1 Tax=Streptomyces sp. NPDC006487 TaxID=3364748 RepID=UPI003680F5AE